MAESSKVSAATAGSKGEKVLRIGVIQGVRVIEERILRKKGPVTFGTADTNTFALGASDLPRSVTVFESKPDGYELVLDDEMQGRLEGPDGKKEFTSLRASTTKKDGVYRLPLADTSKGRVRLSSEITVLFHFVVAPAVAAAPEMPAEVRGGLLRSVEPVFMAVLTASFLVHFAFGVFIKITAPPAPPTLDDLRELVERIKPPKVDVKIPPPKAIETGSATAAATPVDDGKGKGGDGDGDGKPSGESKGKGKGGGGIGDRAAVREGIAGKGILQLIGGRGGGDGDGAVGSVFGSGAGISDDIGGALAGTAGVGIAGGAGGGAGVTRRGTGGGGGGGEGGEGGGAVGIGDLKTEGGGKVDTGAKTAARIVARVKADDVETVDGKIDKKSVAATIRRRQDGFQACYETALKSNSKLAGKIVVEFTIGESGKVTEARVVKDTMNSGEVNGCVVGLLKRLRFPTPAEGEVTISNTFVFQPGG